MNVTPTRLTFSPKMVETLTTALLSVCSGSCYVDSVYVAIFRQVTTNLERIYSISKMLLPPASFLDQLPHLFIFIFFTFFVWTLTLTETLTLCRNWPPATTPSNTFPVPSQMTLTLKLCRHWPPDTPPSNIFLVPSQMTQTKTLCPHWPPATTPNNTFIIPSQMTLCRNWPPATTPSNTFLIPSEMTLTLTLCRHWPPPTSPSNIFPVPSQMTYKTALLYSIKLPSLYCVCFMPRNVWLDKLSANRWDVNSALMCVVTSLKDEA